MNNYVVMPDPSKLNKHPFTGNNFNKISSIFFMYLVPIFLKNFCNVVKCGTFFNLNALISLSDNSKDSLFSRYSLLWYVLYAKSGNNCG